MDITTIVILIIIAVLLLYVFRRNQSSVNTGSGSQMGSERPRYDDRNIQGQGSFGTDNSNNDRNYMPADRRAEDLREAIDPSIRRNQSHDAQSTGNDERAGAGAVNRSSEVTRTSSDRDEPRRTDDSPNVQGQGSFGRDKS
jgi:hypothetical protein